MADASASIAINLDGDVFTAIRELQNDFTKLTGKVDLLDDSVKKSFNTLNNQAKQATQSLRILALNAVSELVNNLDAPFKQGAQGVYTFDHGLRELSAITDVTGKDLQLIGKYARENAKNFGGDPAESLRSFTILLSKLSPEIAKNPQALGLMGEQVSVLSKTMNGDGVGAVNALSSAMNQFNVDLSDPVKAAAEMEVMMNQMAAGAKVGSVEVPGIAQALDQAGAVAHSAGISFAETNAAIQVLGKYGKEGAEGGVALRNVLSIMQRQEFLPKEVRQQLEDAGVSIKTLANNSLSLHARLGELKKIAGNQALLSGMFGMENTVAIKGLLEQTDLLKDFTEEIENSKTAARDMAAVIGESYQETRGRIVAWFNDIKMTMFGFTGDLLPWIDITLGGLTSIIGFMPGVMATAEAFKMLAASQKLQALWTNIASAATAGYTVVVKALNYAFLSSPVGWIVAGLGAVVAAVVYAWNHFEGFRAALYGVWESAKQVFSNIAGFFKMMFEPVIEAIEAFKDGRYADAAKAIGKTVLNLNPVGMAYNAAKYAAEGGFTAGVAEAYKQGAEKGSKSFLEDQKEENPTGPVLAPGTENKKTNEAYSNMPMSGSTHNAGSSGSQVRNNNIRIEHLVGQIIIQETKNISDLKQKIRDAVNEALIAAVRDTEVAIS